jgi:hypothetical protein
MCLRQRAERQRKRLWLVDNLSDHAPVWLKLYSTSDTD